MQKEKTERERERESARNTNTFVNQYWDHKMRLILVSFYLLTKEEQKNLLSSFTFCFVKTHAIERLTHWFSIQFPIILFYFVSILIILQTLFSFFFFSLLRTYPVCHKWFALLSINFLFPTPLLYTVFKLPKPIITKEYTIIFLSAFVFFDFK
jgi:hypothetical protein